MRITKPKCNRVYVSHQDRNSRDRQTKKVLTKLRKKYNIEKIWSTDPASVFPYEKSQFINTNVIEYSD